MPAPGGHTTRPERANRADEQRRPLNHKAVSKLGVTKAVSHEAMQADPHVVDSNRQKPGVKRDAKAEHAKTSKEHRKLLSSSKHVTFEGRSSKYAPFQTTGVSSQKMQSL